MAVKPDSKGNVKGTKSNDKITWINTKDWAKALTVNAGAGADTVDFKKSTYANTINGEAGDDTIYGGTVADTIKGGAGKDLIYGYNGKDSIFGDAGNDTIYGGNGDDYLNGGANNDKLYGGTGTDTVMGGDGDDSLYGDDGIDSVVGGNGNDYIEGGAGFGRLFGLTGNDTIYGGKDKDTIDGGDDNDELHGGEDSDTVKGNTGNDLIYGDEGDDYLYGMKDNDTLYGGKGNDLLDGGDGNDSLLGEEGNDTIRAGAGDDYVNGGAGNDQIQGQSGNDTIYGGAGDDFIEGNDGDDKVYGQAGKDLIRGGNGNDYLDGGDDNDTIQGQSGKNTILGGNGNDSIEGGSGNDSIDGGNGADKIYGQDGNDTIKAGASNDYVEGGNGDDVIYGQSGNNTLLGGAGNDKIIAGTGNDRINAGAGTNSIQVNNNAGTNTILNGGGTDTLVLTSVTNLNNIETSWSDNDLIIQSGNTNIVLNGYKTTENHSVKYIQAGSTKKSINDVLPVPPQHEDITINGTRVIVGDDDANTLTTSGQGTNRIYGHAGNDSITTTGNSWTTNYIYAGGGNDTIISGASTDYIYGGSGENKIYLSTGSGTDYTFDENDNTFVFKDITNLDSLIFTGGEQDFLGRYADLTITGYGNNSSDSLTIIDFFNLEGYDYSKIKLQAGTNGTPVSLYELINESDLKTTYFTGTWKSRPKAITTSPAQKAPQIDSVIYGNNPGAGSHNVLLGTAGGNNTFYSGGGNTGIAGSGVYGATMIYGGDGDETFHTEGNIIYFNDNGTLRTYEQESIYVVDNPNGTKEVSMGVYYRTSETETPIGTYKDYYGEEHLVFYTEDADKIDQIPDDDKFGTSFIYTVDNHQYVVNYITSSVLAVEGGGGNDTFYTGHGADGDDGNDTIIGSGVMYGNRGDDKFYLTDEYKDSLAPMYNVYTNSGNDYIDTTGISNGNENVHVGFAEGVNTLIVDGSRKVDISIDTTSTYREEEPVSGFIETRYSFQARNTHYTAFVQGEDLYIASNNSNKSDSEEAVSYDGKGAGVLIIKGWTNLSDTQKDNITISYRELLATSNYTGSTYTINEFLKIIDGTSDSFIADGNGRHTYINEYGNERINETYTFNVINNSDGALSTINENGETQVATRNIYDEWGNFTVTGTEQRAVDYFIIGGNGAQVIKGGDGNDVIYGDNINGHDENGDYIYATANDGADTIYGGKGSDYIIGGAGNDFIDGGSGTDYLDGGDGNDTLVGGTLGEEEEFNISLLTGRFSLKEIHGGNGNDTIYSLGSYTDDTFNEANSKTYLGGNTYFTNNIYAGSGNDEIHANAYRDVVYAGKGNDTITSYAGNNDYYYNSNATSEIYGEEGNDHIILKSHADVRAFGGDGDDIIDGRDATVTYYNMLWGGNGNDIIYGSSGKDIIYTGQGDNYVEAGDGDDEIYGSDETLVRGGDNTIHAGAGNDYIKTLGSSKVYGEDGNDTIYIATGYAKIPSNLLIDGGAGDDTYIAAGEYGYDTIVASTGKDVIEFKAFVKANTSYQYNGNDLVLSYNTAGLILKDYKLNGFSNFTIKTYNGYAQNGQYSMTDFINYLDGNYQMAANGTEGDDAISSTGTINGLGGNDFIIACSSTSTYYNPQSINTGSGNNSVVAQSKYSTITGSAGNDEYYLQGYITTLTDEGGNNSITVADSLGNNNLYFDITLNGNGNNTITSAENADCCCYKITATGSGKQTININSTDQLDYYVYDENNELVETKTYKTEIKTGSGDDEISLYLGSVEAGEGADTITVKNGAGSGSYLTNGATLKGEEGNDSYVIEGGYDYQGATGISINTKVLITDTEGTNDVTFTSDFMTHDNLNLLLNVKADGTLEEFKHYEYNPETGENDITGTGYSAFICGDKDLKDAGSVSTASCSGWAMCDGVKFADTATVSNLSKIEASDGYYISSERLATVMEQAATWLTTDDRNYASVWDAIKPEGQNDFNENNYNALYAIFNNENNWTQGV